MMRAMQNPALQSAEPDLEARTTAALLAYREALERAECAEAELIAAQEGLRGVDRRLQAVIEGIEPILSRTDAEELASEARAALVRFHAAAAERAAAQAKLSRAGEVYAALDRELGYIPNC